MSTHTFPGSLMPPPTPPLPTVVFDVLQAFSESWPHREPSSSSAAAVPPDPLRTGIQVHSIHPLLLMTGLTPVLHALPASQSQSPVSQSNRILSQPEEELWEQEGKGGTRRRRLACGLCTYVNRQPQCDQPMGRAGHVRAYMCACVQGRG